MIERWFGTTLFGLRLGRDDAGWLLPWLLALSVYVAGLSGIGLVVASASRRSAEQSLAAAMTLEVPADTSPARLETVLALLRQTQGIAAARVVDAAETARLLEPWLGPAARLDELPVPKSVELRSDPGKAVEVAALRQRLASIVPDAQLDDHRQLIDRVRMAALRVEIMLAAAVAIALLAVAAAAVFATRSALGAERLFVDLAHQLGATDRDIARPFAMRALRLGLSGGLIGSIAVAASAVALDGVGSIVQPPAPIAATGIADWRLWAILVATVLAAGVIAMASAFLTASYRLSDLP